MTARNAPCPCGSGKKFRKCHGVAAAESAPGIDPLEAARAELAGGNIDAATDLASQAPASIARSRLLGHLLISRRTGGDLERAVRVLQQWAAADAANPEPWQRLTEVFLFQAKVEQAAVAHRAMADRAPRHPKSLYFAAVLEQLSGRPDEALTMYAQAIEAQGFGPSADPVTALALASAMQMYETAAGNYPGSPSRQQEGMFDCHEEKALLEAALLRWEAACETSGVEPTPQERKAHSLAWYNLGCAALAGYTDSDRRMWLFRKAVDLDPGNELARMNYAFASNYSTALSPGQIFALHRDSGDWLVQQYAQSNSPPAFDVRGNGRLRVGYLSADFRDHSVAHFILPVLAAHDRNKCEVFLYYNHTKEDEYTHEARALASRFESVTEFSDLALCKRIRSDGIDVLVDLNGLTQHHRLPVFAMRSAPVQITWIGYPNTTGLRTIDYRIVDDITDPAAETQADTQTLATETLLRMSPGFSVYGPPRELPDVTPAPCMTSGAITFGSFNNMAKLNDPLIRLWSEILRRVPGSRILLKNVALTFESSRQQLLGRFADWGIGAERVILQGMSASKTEHLASYGMVDICLDSFPYNGTTTTCDSLIMGTPVVSLAGTDHRSRVGASLLASVGLECLVSHAESGYIETAVRLAADTAAVADLRCKLRAQMMSSPLMDATTFTRQLENKYATAVREWRRQKEEK